MKLQDAKSQHTVTLVSACDITCQNIVIFLDMIDIHPQHPSMKYTVTFSGILRTINMNSKHTHINQACKISIVRCHHIKGRTLSDILENREQRAVLGPKRQEATGRWKKFYNEKLHDLYYLTIIWVIKL
jgi:hypothetical protein